MKRELVVVLHPGNRVASGMALAETLPAVGVDNERIAFVFTVQRTLESGIVAPTKARLAEVALDELAQVELCFELFYIDHAADLPKLISSVL